MIGKKTCDVCGKEFNGNGKRCSPECSHAYHRAYVSAYDKANYDVIKQRKDKRYRCNRVEGNFFCPMCGQKHNTPADKNGHRYQYCFPCRDNFAKYGMPADERAEEHGVLTW